MAKNQGQQYEEAIRTILKKRHLLPSDLADNDAGFIHNRTDYYLEVKNKTAPDFGQKGLVWNSTTGWEWRETDVMTQLYDQLGVRFHIPQNFIPKKYSIPPDLLSQADKTYDQNHFELRNILLDRPDYLYEYYERKHCYYIQIEGKGFYYLKRDVASLGVPQFVPQLTLRLRAKTHHSIPLQAYSFFAVLQAQTKALAPSPFDIDEKVGSFPSITK